MRLPFWINYFDFAFNFFTSFGYFRTEREHYNAVRTIAQSPRRLLPGINSYPNRRAFAHIARQSPRRCRHKKISGWRVVSSLGTPSRFVM